MEVAGLLYFAFFLAHSAPPGGAPNDKQSSGPDSPRAIRALGFLVRFLLLFLVTYSWRAFMWGVPPENLLKIQWVTSAETPNPSGSQ